MFKGSPPEVLAANHEEISRLVKEPLDMPGDTDTYEAVAERVNGVIMPLGSETLIDSHDGCAKWYEQWLSAEKAQAEKEKGKE